MNFVNTGIRKATTLHLKIPRFLSNNIPTSTRTYNTPIKRSLSSSSPDTNLAFDRKRKTLQRSSVSHPEYRTYDYLKTEIASRLVDRLDDIIRDDGFPLALDIGSGPGFLYRQIIKDEGLGMPIEDGGSSGGIGGVRKLVMLDSSAEMLHRDEDEDANIPADEKARCGTYKLVGDEEGPLPFPDGTFDLVLSSTSMHWVNDLPGLWKEVKRVLKPDGCFMFAMVGGATFTELRSSLVLAEMERDGGVSPHVGPFVDFSDVGSLLTGAGFNLTTIDIDTIKLGFPNGMICMEHLQRMGEGNACLNRRERLGLDTFLASSCIYDELYPLDGQEKNESDVEATVQVIYGIGWTPHESQPKPKERGSATQKIGDVVVEQLNAGAPTV